MRLKNKILYLITLAGILSGILAGVFFSLAHDLPQINQLKSFKPAAVTSVYSADRQRIGEIYIEKRFPVSLSQIPDYLVDALLTIEDRHFYHHSGIHFKGILRAIVQDIKAGKLKQGASTLTQQLAKTLFLSSEKSFTRKIKEAILTLQIERRYSKDEILELYLNQIYFGAGTYGVEAACRTYFGKSVSQISLSQAALIAALPKAPSYYSPRKNIARATKRRNLVLKQMLLYQVISQPLFNEAINEEIRLPDKPPFKPSVGHFLDYIRQRMNEMPFKLDRSTSDGLTVHTTLHLDYQDFAWTQVQKEIRVLKDRMSKNGHDASKAQIALIALDTQTGRILCMIGGHAYQTGAFNRSVQALRQPGSAFKPFVYAMALSQGYSQADVILDAPLSYPAAGNTTWQVRNFSNTFSGEMTLRKALALSKNTPVVRLLEKIDPQTVIGLARKSGMTSPMAPTLSMALGTYEVSLLELTAAYATFANAGIYSMPFAIDKITDEKSRVIFENSPQKAAIMDREVAAEITDMLKAVIREGTGKKAGFIKKEIAGKTGTTDQNKDALFIGFAPDIALGVWVGNDDSRPLGNTETGAKAALPLWGRCMEYFLLNRPVQYFDIPEKTKVIYLNPDTGDIATQPLPGTVKALIKETE